MMLRIPFFPQTTETNCVPAAARMILSYFDSDPGIEKVEEIMGYEEGKAAPTLFIATVAAKAGYKVKFFTKVLGLDIINFDLDFYKKYQPKNSIDMINSWIADAKASGVELHERTINLDKLLSYLSSSCLVVVLLDWNVISRTASNSFNGHTVIITGYDKEFVYVHNQGKRDTQANFPIERELFDKARKSKGTDEDVVIIEKI